MSSFHVVTDAEMVRDVARRSLLTSYDVLDTPERAVGEMHWIHVDPDHRGEGIGSALFERSREAQVEARTAPDGETVYVTYEEIEIGSAGPFFATYRTAKLDERYGWFCSNCETFDNAVGPMGRLVCNECGNRHKATRWDAVATE